MNTLDKINEVLNSLDEIEKQIRLSFLSSDESGWPLAALPNRICNPSSEQDKKTRAEGILDSFVDESLFDKKFLDFGCGEGHVAIAAMRHNASLSVGYDIQRSGISVWEQSSPLLTTDFEKVITNGPYTVILLYDVLDHCDDPIQVLRNIEKLMKDHTHVYVRTHPWTSRHGGHQYNTSNKAFYHILNEKSDKNYRDSDYESWFEYARLKVKKKSIVSTPIETFFNRPDLKSVLQEYGDHASLSVDHFDYTLVLP